MSAASQDTSKILALIYFVLGISSLVIGVAGIATGKLESTYGSNAMLAAAVVIAKGPHRSRRGRCGHQKGCQQALRR